MPELTLTHLPLPVTQTDRINKLKKFFRKVVKFNQMDFQFASWQICYLFMAPQKLSKIFRARKQSKSQYARDDPAFLVFCISILLLESVVFGISFKLTFYKYLKFLFIFILCNFLGIGCIITTFIWSLTNTILNFGGNHIEWGYSFDIHINALFVPLVFHQLMQIVYYFWSNNYPYLIMILGNTIYGLSAIYYNYITFLGYNIINPLESSKLLLAPIPWILLFYILFIIFNINIAGLLFYLYTSYIV